MHDELASRIDKDGLAVQRRVFDASKLESMKRDLDATLRAAGDDSPIRSRRGRIYAARNLITVWPPVRTMADSPAISAALSAVLGGEFGLVRALFFDKPPGGGWSLPWHKDMTITVRDNRRGGSLFTHPTYKAGVPHVEAPRCVLDEMLTVRVHLDDMTLGNGPLIVIPGSHRAGKTMLPAEDEGREEETRKLLLDAGDVLLMRPLVVHGSIAPRDTNDSHRRVVHLEFAANRELPNGYQWHDFLPKRIHAELDS